MRLLALGHLSADFQRRLFASSVLLVCLGATTLVGQTAFTSERAFPADPFVDSIGIVVHLENTGTAYRDHLTDYIEPALIASGIRHLRDGGMASTLNTYGMKQVYTQTYSAVASLVQQSTGHRLGFDLILAPLNGGSSNGKNSCDWLTKSPVSSILQYMNPQYIDGFEGLNEYDWEFSQFTPNCVSASTWVANDIAFQRAIYADIKSQPSTSFFPVAGPSFGTVNGMALMGSVSGYEDFATQHSYPDGRYPSADIAENEAQLSHVNGNKPYVATETGYYTMPDGVSGISEEASGKYMSRLFLEYYRAGIVRTYGYELIDDVTQPGYLGHFGLLRADGSHKPAFTAVTNEIAILQDPGTPETAGELAYSLGKVPSTLHHFLFQKRNGTFYLALWQEVSSYDLMKQADLTSANLAVQVSLQHIPTAIHVYKPMKSASPTGTLTRTNQFTVQVGDEAVILEIQP